MKALIETLARALVDFPDEVEVEEREESDLTTLELRVAPEDLGKVIGRRGRTATAMRSILSATASRESRRAVLEILD
ncbi:MAG: KH domain-containing protein [Nitrospinae bacterium]|nr:KH domain-containing protein [Nitrospinota bacterium]